MARLTRRAATVVAGAVVGVPSTLGVVVTQQLQRARRTGLLPRPGYEVDVLVDPPWTSGELLRVAFLGDSLVEGVGAAHPDQSLPAQTAYRLAAHLGRPVHMRGLGVASSRVRDVLVEQVPRLDRDVDLVLVVVGANDATRGTAPWEFGRQVEQLAAAAADATGGAPVVFTGLPDLQHAPLLTRPLRDVASAVGDALHLVQRRAAQRSPHGRYVELRDQLAEPFRRRGRDLFAADRYHPNPAGYALIGEVLAREVAHLVRLEALLAAADAADPAERAGPAAQFGPARPPDTGATSDAA